jgi:chloride channel protein, CIC family
MVRGVESLAAVFQRVHGKARPLLGTFLYGLVASLAAVAFQLAISWLYSFFFQRPAAIGGWHFLWVSLATLVVSSLFVGVAMHIAPSAAGSGIPEVKLTFWKEFGQSPRRIAIIKFLAGVIGIGGGQSLGREGPTVQIGSNLAANLAGLLGVSKQNRRAASAAGAAAGLAAAFNAPLASVAFVLEEIIGDLNSRSLGPVLLASVMGAFVVHAFIGPQPAFVLPQIKEPTWRAYSLMPLSAAFAAVAGVYFQRWCLALRGLSRRVRGIPRWTHPAIAGLITWAIGAAVFVWGGRLGVFALGYDDLTDALVHGIVWKLAAVLLIGKFIATVAGYGLGGCGGIFSPNLFFGGMCGAVVVGLGKHFMAVSESDAVLVIVGGMSACLGAVVQAPVTAILIIFEMTHQFALVPGLMLAGLVSQAIARSMNRVNFYDEILQQDGHEIEHVVPPRDLRSWQNLPISAIANFKPITIEDKSEAKLKELLERHPYRHFPVIEGDKLIGVANREEITVAIAESRVFRMEPAVTCRPGETIRQSQTRLIESKTGTLALTDQDDGRVLGIVTLHDLLRAQLALGDREER